MVAAAKLRRAQEAAEASRPTQNGFNAVMGGLASGAAGSALRQSCLSGTGQRSDPPVGGDDC